MRLGVSALLVAMFLMVAVPAIAHHSFTSFWYMDKTVEITGVVKAVKLVNPHANMVIEVTEANGQKSDWPPEFRNDSMCLLFQVFLKHAFEGSLSVVGKMTGFSCRFRSVSSVVS